MNQKIKKTLVAIVGLLLSTSAFAHDFEVNGIYYNYLDKTAKTVSVTYKGNSSNNYTNEYTGTITIPSSVTYSGTTYSVTKIGESAFYYCTGLTSITIPNSVTSIGDLAFYGTAWYNNQADGVIYINNVLYEYKGTIPEGTSISIKDGTVSISPSAFIYCDGLTSITIPNSVTSIGDYAFYYCTGLTEVNISDLSAWCKIDFSNNTANPLYYAKKLKLNGAEIKDLVIPNDITKIKDYAFYGCTGLTSITIPNSVTSIGSYAFSGTAWYNNQADGVIYINNVLYEYKGTIPEGTSISIKDGTVSISPSAFDVCTGLTSITIPNSVTSIGDYAFYYCTGLTSITIPNSVTSIGGDAFRNCTGLTEVNYNAENCTSMGSNSYPVFEYCSNLKTLNIGNEVKTIPSFAFYDCTGLTSVTIGNSVTSIGYHAFRNCTGLTSITIPNSVTSIGDEAFYGCSNIHSLTIGSGISSISSNTFSVKPKKTIWLTNTPPSGYSNVAGTINYVANDQYSSLSNVKVYPYLSSIFEVDGVKYVPVSPSERTCDAIDCSYNFSDSIINIGNTVSFKGVAMSVKDIKPYTCYGNDYINDCLINFNGNIGEYAFYSCDSIEYLNLSVNDIKGYAFQNSATVNPATFSINAKSIANSAFNGCSAIEKASINSETIGANAFQYSATKNLATFSIDAKSIAGSAFSNCSAIETITLGNELETIGNSAFNSCSKLNEVVIPNSVTSLGESAFSGCSSLASATIGNAVENINSSTFYNCKSLENIIIGNTVKSIGNNTFYGCSSLPSIEIPKNVTSIGNYAFDNCNKLSDVIIEDRSTILTLGSNGSSPMFSDCPLDSVYIGGDISYKTTSSCGYSPFYNNKTLRAVTITDKETEISDNEFYGCANLKSVSIGDGVETIGKYAFSGCSSLESFAFGSSMKTIGEEAFSDCTALIKLSSKATTPPACGTQALDDINKWNCELIVPDDAISAYQTADQWKEFFFISPNKIDEITTNVNDAIEIARYDIHGRLLSEPSKGINIIKYSDGSTRKEIVK